MKRIRRVVWSCLALSPIGLLAWAYLDPTEDAPASSPPLLVAKAEPPPPAGRRTALVRERTETESLAGATAPTPEAPPAFEPAAPTTEGPARAPDGYAYAAFAGAMRTGPVASDPGADPDPDRTPAWATAPGGRHALMRQAAAANRDWTFGWVALAPNADPRAVGAALHAAGGHLLGIPGALVRARLPGDRARLDAVMRIPGLHAVGVTPPDLKLPPALARTAQAAPLNETIPLFVTLMDDDTDGRWRAGLSRLGAVVGRYDAEIRVYVANVPAEAVAAVAAADFVMAVEPVGMARAAHDTAVPAMGADAVRRFDAAAGLFSGTSGAAVPVGVMDTGLNTRHLDIGPGRRSICGANFTPLFDAREQDHDLWIDAGFHGTHTTGTILGTGAGDRRYAGMAPGVRDIRFAKVLSDVGFGDLDAILRGIDFLARPTACGGEPLKPLVVNVSLGSDGVDWRARTVAERKLDAAVWNHRQLYVVANSNSGFIALGDFAAAKNSLAVGAVHDSGDVANFSSSAPPGTGGSRPWWSARASRFARPAVAGAAPDTWRRTGPAWRRRRSRVSRRC